MLYSVSLVSSPSAQLSSLAVRFSALLRTASGDSGGEGLGTRLGYGWVGWYKYHIPTDGNVLSS